MRTVSLKTKIQQVSGLIDTTLIDSRTNEFLQNIVEQTKEGLVTSGLTEKQIAWIERIYDQEFA